MHYKIKDDIYQNIILEQFVLIIYGMFFQEKILKFKLMKLKLVFFLKII